MGTFTGLDMPFNVKILPNANLVPRAFPSKNGWGREKVPFPGPTHFLREKPWGRGWPNARIVEKTSV